MVLEYLRTFGKASRRDIDELLLDKLGDVLTDAQKHDKISNLLSSMRRTGLIRNVGSKKSPEWRRTHDTPSNADNSAQ